MGGTGLYVDSVVFDYEFGEPANYEFREYLNQLTLEELYEYCNKNNVELPENNKNKRYVIRAIERGGEPKRHNTPKAMSIIVGITTEKELLRTRINDRIEQLFDNGVVEEATILGKKYDWKNEAMTGNIYPIVHSYIEGAMSIEEAKEKAKTQDWHLAKRQMTWLRRNLYIKWYSLKEANEYLTGILAKV